MKKTYRMRNVDCANCAAKMERSIGKIPGVKSAEVSFMAQRLTMEVDPEQLESILPQVKQCVAKVDPHAVVLGI